MNIEYIIYKSPLGNIYISADGEGVCRIDLFEEHWKDFAEKNVVSLNNENELCVRAQNELEEYFQGKRIVFQVPLSLKGTEFQKSVWNELLKIPYGETRSYKQIAESIGRPKAVRAIGQANRVNKLPIIIPCHRVIGANGGMVGYAGAKIDVKKKLLILEGFKVE